MIAALVMAASALIVYDRSRPLEDQILSAQRVDFIGEASLLDGGSVGFFFELPRLRSMTLVVKHRGAEDLGGNAEFQEIWLDQAGARKPHMVLQPGSQLESKIVALLSSATFKTNAGHFAAQPRPERLQWVLERIRDRKSTW